MKTKIVRVRFGGAGALTRDGMGGDWSEMFFNDSEYPPVG